MINIGEKELCFLPYSLSLLSDWISEKTCRWQAFKAFIFRCQLKVNFHCHLR